MKVYGKKRKPNFAASFKNLRLSSSPKQSIDHTLKYFWNQKLIKPETDPPKPERQPLGPKSVNVLAITTCVESDLEAKCEIKEKRFSGKETIEIEEKELLFECERDLTFVVSANVPGSDDDHCSTAKPNALSSKNAHGSPSQEGERSLLAVTGVLDSALSLDERSGEASTPALEVLRESEPTMKNNSFSKTKERSTSTFRATQGRRLKDKNEMNAKESKTRKLRSAAPCTTITRTDSTEHACLTKEIRTYLEPLTNLEGVVSKIKHIQKWYDEWTLHCDVIKIAEGSFGSVFKLSDKEGLLEPTIGKLMPLKPKSGKGSRKSGYTHVRDAVSEIRLLETMSQVPGFVQFRSAEVLIGELPKPLKQAYRTYKARCKGAKTSFCDLRYSEDQTWVFIEMGNAGTELEDALLPETEENMILEKDDKDQWMLRVQEIRDVFWGVAEALANGEEAQEFEHRDMHFSNICIQRKQTREDNGYLLIPSDTNIEVTLIDYTLSRATLQSGVVVCNTMTDETIFSGEDDLQFDVYRWMREQMPGQDVRRKQWEAFVPMTNVLWLYHLLEKLMAFTARPELYGDERNLWDSLNELKDQINPNNKQFELHNSATDIVSYARGCVTNLDGSKDDVSQTSSSSSPAHENSTDHDLSARFECIRI